MFVFTADESGVKRFEHLLDITPKAAQSLEERKARIISVMNRKKMSLSELTTVLQNYCEGIRLVSNMAEMEMLVEMSNSTIGMNTVYSILEEILPLNIYIYFKLRGQKAVTKTAAFCRECIKMKVKPLLPKTVKASAKGHFKIQQRSRTTMAVRRG